MALSSDFSNYDNYYEAFFETYDKFIERNENNYHLQLITIEETFNVFSIIDLEKEYIKNMIIEIGKTLGTEMYGLHYFMFTSIIKNICKFFWNVSLIKMIVSNNDYISESYEYKELAKDFEFIWDVMSNLCSKYDNKTNFKTTQEDYEIACEMFFKLSQYTTTLLDIYKRKTKEHIARNTIIIRDESPNETHIIGKN
ncbi:hypothetical protein EIN_150740 [Entamoeba invadens IP1]|uniref:Uncharacterized protein n=1 Tax=Entamoeba invadens IP1 TaxID=370355 RepID=L7FKW5_ENTIV|nr:hypothetical protein EIN_326140 [Entamoeba invadens IP1]XP_004257968.1 hypothetical protein EIN_150740 [Entamoeba invadens IP1]ELP87553.1 hypothetical protein EIN_326140 [Entamoeba invadens IP1]ELP91197.1 hypothetical protein EIN_150740 [Entamoeba invadens IP1]|eukprot:XP_004254324.1 hypothetical protein EIN_326140 [Entamoeba invadens IP1]